MKYQRGKRGMGRVIQRERKGVEINNNKDV